MKFQVGDRVKVNLVEVPVRERQCDVGLIIGIRLKHSKELRYTIRFDRPYIKPEFVFIQNIEILEVESTLLEGLK